MFRQREISRAKEQVCAGEAGFAESCLSFFQLFLKVTNLTLRRGLSVFQRGGQTQKERQLLNVVIS